METKTRGAQGTEENGMLDNMLQDTLWDEFGLYMPLEILWHSRNHHTFWVSEKTASIKSAS